MSTNNSPERAKRIFEEALDLGSAEARFGYLKGACGGDAELLARVQTLLRAHDESGGFLPENPGGATAATARLAPGEGLEAVGTRIGRYKLLQKIGEGGCGTVYMAEQEEPVRRRVALKVIKLGMDTKEVIARFEAERQALAMMDHPNIAKVLDAGATENGRPFFAMELVKGIPITRYCDENSLSTEDRLKLFAQVCNAVQHAHQKGIIHRDLKPSNILVTLHDGVPVPKVIDFGIAKATQGRLTDHTLFTAFEQFIGTPAYMSPEQAEMSGLDIDTRSDIYSLGVLLYELLTGSTPFETKALMQAGLDEMRRQIREVEPQRPSTRLRTLASDTLTSTAQHRRTDAPRLFQLIHGDLDWIVMRCLEKDRTRRYETATGLARDLQRHLDNEPIEARPISRAYRFRKMVRRNRLAFAAGAAVAGSLVVGIIISTAAYFNEKAAHRFAVEAATSQLRAANSNQSLMIKSREALERAAASGKRAAIEEARSTYAVEIMNDVIKASAPGAAGEKARPIGQFLDPTAERLEKDKQISAEAKQDLAERTGDIYMAWGEFARAEHMYRQTLALRRDLFGAVHPATAAAAEKLIESLKRQGKSSEAEQTRRADQAGQAEYLQSDRWTKSLKTQAEELRKQGRYDDAEANVRAAMTITQKNLGAQYNPYPDLGQIARIRLEAGDLAAAKELAAQWLEAEKRSRRWGPATSGRLFASADSYPVPAEAHTLLGQVALREGQPAAAREHLLRSAINVTPWKKLGEKDLRLASELMAAGDQAAALQFLDEVRVRYVDILEDRGFSTNPVGWGVSWSNYYSNLARARENAAELDGWRSDIVAGRLPEQWRPYLPVTRPTAMTAAPPPASLPNPPVAPLRPPAILMRPWLPFSVLLLGWFSATLVTPGRATRQLPRPAGKWLFAFCLARTFESLLFGRALFGEGPLPNFLVELVVSLVSWVFLWEFARALNPAKASPGEARIVRGSAWGILIAVGGIELLSYITKSDWAFITTVFVLLTVALVSFLLPIIVGVVAGARLWHWVAAAGFSRAWSLGLKAAAVLLGAYGLISLFGPAIHDAKESAGFALLWITALLPWLLAAGFFFAKTATESSALPPARLSRIA